MPLNRLLKRLPSFDYRFLGGFLPAPGPTGMFKHVEVLLFINLSGVYFDCCLDNLLFGRTKTASKRTDAVPPQTHQPELKVFYPYEYPPSFYT